MSFFDKKSPTQKSLFLSIILRWKQILAVLLGISLIIIVHELGHWSFCTLFGVGTPTFSIGIGPTLFEKKVGRTLFSFSLLPLGGYTSILGRYETIPLYPQASFTTKPAYQQLLIILGGVIFNMLFALFINIFQRLRRKRQKASSLTQETAFPQKIIGPLGIINLIAQKTTAGYASFFSLLAWLSFNIALFNLLPLPLLDGGQAVILMFEKIVRHPLHEKISTFISLVSLTIIGLLLIYTLVQDFRQLSKKDLP